MFVETLPNVDRPLRPYYELTALAERRVFDEKLIADAVLAIKNRGEQKDSNV